MFPFYLGGGGAEGIIRFGLGEEKPQMTQKNIHRLDEKYRSPSFLGTLSMILAALAT